MMSPEELLTTVAFPVGRRRGGIPVQRLGQAFSSHFGLAATCAHDVLAPVRSLRTASPKMTAACQINGLTLP
jgi:hypothetical protein